MKKTIALLHFYKSIFVLPFTLSIIPIFIAPSIPFIVILFAKILIFGVIWFFKYIEDKEDKTFYFYYNNGLSKSILFLFSFSIDLTIALIINYVL